MSCSYNSLAKLLKGKVDTEESSKYDTNFNRQCQLILTPLSQWFSPRSRSHSLTVWAAIEWVTNCLLENPDKKRRVNSQTKLIYYNKLIVFTLLSVNLFFEYEQIYITNHKVLVCLLYDSNNNNRSDVIVVKTTCSYTEDLVGFSK